MVKQDPYAEGYNQGFSDYQAGKARKPHALSRLKKFILMRGQEVGSYVRAYHQGYEASVRKGHIEQAGRRQADERADRPHSDRDVKRRLGKLRRRRHQRRRDEPGRER